MRKFLPSRQGLVDNFWAWLAIGIVAFMASWMVRQMDGNDNLKLVVVGVLWMAAILAISVVHSRFGLRQSSAVASSVNPQFITMNEQSPPSLSETPNSDEALTPVPPADDLSELIAALKVPRYKVNGRSLSSAAFLVLVRRELATGVDMAWFRGNYHSLTRERLRDLDGDLMADLSIAGIVEIDRRTTTEFGDNLSTRAFWELTPLGRRVAWRIQSDPAILSEIEGFLSPIPNVIFTDVWEEVGRVVQNGRVRQTAKWFASIRLIRGPETLCIPTFLEGLQTGESQDRVALPVADGEQLSGGDLNLTKWKDARVWLFAYDGESGEFLIPQKGRDYLVSSPAKDPITVKLLAQAPNDWFSCTMKFQRADGRLVIIARSGTEG